MFSNKSQPYLRNISDIKQFYLRHISNITQYLMHGFTHLCTTLILIQLNKKQQLGYFYLNDLSGGS